MKKKFTNNSRRLEKIVFIAFIVFCIGVLAWDIGKSGGLSAAWASLPASEPLGIPEPNGAIADYQISTDTHPDQKQPKANDTETKFASLRLEREQARGDELTLLQQIISDENSSDAAKEDAEKRRLAMASDMEKEIRAESILDAKGYAPALVMIGGNQTTVILDMEIEEKDALIIAEIVDKACNCGFENVVIVKR